MYVLHGKRKMEKFPSTFHYMCPCDDGVGVCVIVMYVFMRRTNTDSIQAYKIFHVKIFHNTTMWRTWKVIPRKWSEIFKVEHFFCLIMKTTFFFYNIKKIPFRDGKHIIFHNWVYVLLYSFCIYSTHMILLASWKISMALLEWKTYNIMYFPLLSTSIYFIPNI